MTIKNLSEARQEAQDMAKRNPDSEIRHLAEIALVILRRLTEMTDDGR